MKPDAAGIAVLALIIIVVVIPAALYISHVLNPYATPRITDYCNANGYREVFACADGSFQTIREDYTEGFSIVRPDGSRLDCPFTLPQFQEGECRDYTVQGMCGGENLCESGNPCVSDLDCPGECVNWTCS
jgi:hypothetical protein